MLRVVLPSDLLLKSGKLPKRSFDFLLPDGVTNLGSTSWEKLEFSPESLVPRCACRRAA